MAQKTSWSFVGLSKTSPRFLDRALRRWPHQSSTVWRRRPNAKPTMRIEGASKKRRFVLIKKRNGAVLRPRHSTKRRRGVFAKENGLRKRLNARPKKRTEAVSKRKRNSHRKPSAA